MPPESDFGGLAQAIINLVQAAGFGGLVWYLLVKHIPNENDKHTNEREKAEEKNRLERQEWLHYIKTRDQEYDALIKDYMLNMEKLREELKDLKRITAKT